MKRKLAWVFLGCLLILGDSVIAQESEDAPQFGVFISAGLGLNSIDGWNLDFWITDIEVPPDLFVAGGVFYGPLPLASSTEFFISGEIGYTNCSGTGSSPQGYTSGKVEINRTPAMAWFTMASKGSFGPLFRVGIGASYLEFSETYYPDRSDDVELNYWTFCYGFGGGIFYNTSDRVSIWLNVDGVLDATTVHERRPISGIETGMSGLHGFAVLSIRGVVWF